MADFLIRGKFVITMSGEGLGIIEDGAVAVAKDEIVDVGAYSELETKFPEAKKIGGERDLIMPGFVDAHIHTGIAIMRGLAQDIKHWMQRGIAPFKRSMSLEELTWGSMVNIIEGLKAGTTTFSDYDYPLENIIDNHLKIGTRGCLTSTINEMSPNMDKLEIGELYPLDENLGEKRLEEAEAQIERWQGAGDGRISFMWGPQGPDMLGEKLLQKIKEKNEKYQLKIHMHVAQGDREIEQMEKRYGLRPIPYLDKLGYLDQDLIAVHLTEATDEEAAFVAEKGAAMVCCPGSIGIIDGLVPPLLTFLEAGGNAALGSDQAPGNNCNNMFNEMKMAAILNKVKKADPTAMPAWKVLRLATIEGAKVLGLEDRIGSLEKGKKADILMVDLNEPSLVPAISTPMRNLVPNLVYSARGNEVKTVMINGKIVMRDREIVTVDEKEVVEKATQAGENLGKRAEEDFWAAGTETGKMMEKGYL